MVKLEASVTQKEHYLYRCIKQPHVTGRVFPLGFRVGEGVKRSDKNEKASRTAFDFGRFLTGSNLNKYRHRNCISYFYTLRLNVSNFMVMQVTM